MMIANFAGIRVYALKNGSFKVSLDNGKYQFVYKTFNECGSEVYEFAPNNDAGRKLNHQMCRNFGRNFFKDNLSDSVWE